MIQLTNPHPPARVAIPWLRYALLLLLAEKVVQHVFVTLAFWFNWQNIAATVVVNPTVLTILGALAAVLFALALWGALHDKKWASLLAGGMALFDIVGEFAAQGTLAITLNVSFLAAALLLVLAFFNWRRLARS
jgi:hypothetical protein